MKKPIDLRKSRKPLARKLWSEKPFVVYVEGNDQMLGGQGRKAERQYEEMNALAEQNNGEGTGTTFWVFDTEDDAEAFADAVKELDYVEDAEVKSGEDRWDKSKTVLKGPSITHGVQIYVRDADYPDPESAVQDCMDTAGIEIEELEASEYDDVRSRVFFKLVDDADRDDAIAALRDEGIIKSHRPVAKSFNVCVFGDRGIDDDYAVSDLAKEWGASSAQDNSFDFDSKRDAKGFAKEAENLPGVDRVDIINLETGEEASFDPKRKAANSSYEAFALLERLAGSSNLDDSPTLQECLKDILDASEEGTKNVPQSYYENAQEALDKYKKRDGLGAFDIEDALDDFEAMIGAKSHKPVRKSIDEDIDEDRMYTVFVDDWASMDEAERKDVIDAYEPGVSDYSAYGLDMEEVNSEPARFDVPGEDLQRFLDELDSLGVKYQAEILGGKSAKPVTKSMRDDLDAELVDLARVIGEMKVDPRYSEEITDNLEDHYDALYDAAQVGMQEFVDVLEDVGVELPGGFFQRLRKLADDVDDEEQAGKSAKPVRKSLTPAPDLLTVVQVTESLASKIEMSRDVLLATAHDAMLAGADYEEPVSLISELGQLASAIRYLAEDYERYAAASGSTEVACIPFNPWPGSLRYPIDCCARMIGVLTGDPTYETVVETLIEVRDEMRGYCGEETGPVGVPGACCDPY